MSSRQGWRRGCGALAFVVQERQSDIVISCLNCDCQNWRQGGGSTTLCGGQDGGGTGSGCPFRLGITPEVSEYCGKDSGSLRGIVLVTISSLDLKHRLVLIAAGTCFIFVPHS